MSKKTQSEIDIILNYDTKALHGDDKNVLEAKLIYANYKVEYLKICLAEKTHTAKLQKKREKHKCKMHEFTTKQNEQLKKQVQRLLNLCEDYRGMTSDQEMESL